MVLIPENQQIPVVLRNVGGCDDESNKSIDVFGLKGKSSRVS